MNLKYKLVKPEAALADYIYCFSSLQGLSDFRRGIIIPNGRIDLLLVKMPDDQFQIMLMGLETKPKPVPKDNFEKFFAISFNPLALEYMLKQSVADLVDTGKILPSDFLGFAIDDLNNFEVFVEKATQMLRSLPYGAVDERKRRLFQLIFASDGEMSIKTLSEKSAWSERQINRYFTTQLGISLKRYCNIIRFQASLAHIKDGNLFPELNFTDQSHFIKEIKRLSGVSPKVLSKNEDGRFLQFLVYRTT